MRGRRVLLGVTGGIAAYKAVELARLLVRQGAEVRVVMTAGAVRFVGPLSFQAVTGQPARIDLFDPGEEAAMDHIGLARWADLVLVAPATADFMARHAAGLADDLLSTLCLASDRPLWLAPAMNRAMWDHPATRENLQRLQARGVRMLGPAAGEQACGEVGPGRMLEPAEILQALQADSRGRLSGRKVVLTAGPTREPLDPVRFLGNRSSGRMGYALADALLREGAELVLVSGPVALAAPAGAKLVRVETARQMRDAVMAHIQGCDIFVGCAAVADYRPESVAPNKLKKGPEPLQLRLVPNPDILSEVAGMQPAPFTLGFAAETEALTEHAEAKRRAKGVDMIAANLVSEAGIGFDAGDNAITLLWEGGTANLTRKAKTEIARELVTLLVERYLASAGTENSG